MKRLSRVFISVFLAALMATLLPVQVFADTPDYISEIKIAMGDSAETDLEGYTILKDGDKVVDLNQNSGGGIGSKGEKRVILGYKTTTKRSEAITDLALMNMKGGYSVAEYEVLMETQMKTQILPFIEDFQVAIDEYRENYVSKNKANKQRAGYIHDILNKLTDDDTGKQMGDLLLNKTKQELGDEAYDALPEEEKKNHADLATIIAQSNGKATLLIKNLLTRASDTEDDTWIERFVDTSYDALLSQTGKTPSVAKKELAKECDDDANIILSMWDTFRDQLINSDKAAEKLENTELPDEDDVVDEINDIDGADDTEDIAEAVDAILDMQERVADFSNNLSDVAVATYLSTFEYGEGTLYDFFTKTSDEIAEDITVLYPMVAALSEGQRAGLEFIALRELVLITDQSKDYDDTDLDKLENCSIYEGVDRAIYEKGGVALTSDSLRKNAVLNDDYTDSTTLNTITYIFLSLSAASALGLVSTLLSKPIASLIDKIRYSNFEAAKTAAQQATGNIEKIASNTNLAYEKAKDAYGFTSPEAMMAWSMKKTADNTDIANQRAVNAIFEPLNVNTKAVKCFAIGFTVATVIFSGISVYLTYKDLQEKYKVDFTPIPHYMIDEKDLIGYNSKGEKIVLKNQSAYYKAVECNRKESDEYYNTIGTCADMNGDVGSQWLALYAAKNENEKPIIADSLTVVVGSEEVPSEYETGIHMFGSTAAFNLNNKLYDWNEKAPAVFVYYKTDDAVPEATGANFTAGTIALTGGAGLVLGAAVTALAMKSKRNKKENKAVTA